MITNINQLDLNAHYTISDYLTWRLDEMVELIKGRIFKMSPAPSMYHQRVLRNLMRGMGEFTNDSKCEDFCAPFDVFLPLPKKLQKKGKIDTVVQPDLCVVCDAEKLKSNGCHGAPDMIVEIISISTKKKDYNDKYQIYEAAGVREYWIVDPNDKSINVYILNSNGIYEELHPPYVNEKEIPIHIFENQTILMSDIFRGIE